MVVSNNIIYDIKATPLYGVAIFYYLNTVKHTFTFIKNEVVLAVLK